MRRAFLLILIPLGLAVCSNCQSAGIDETYYLARSNADTWCLFSKKAELRRLAPQRFKFTAVVKFSAGNLTSVVTEIIPSGSQETVLVDTYRPKPDERSHSIIREVVSSDGQVFKYTYTERGGKLYLHQKLDDFGKMLAEYPPYSLAFFDQWALFRKLANAPANLSCKQ